MVNLVKGATKSMVIDFGVLIEGKAEDELPERLIGALAGFQRTDDTLPKHLVGAASACHELSQEVVTGN